MSRRRPPVLLFESNRGRDLRVFSLLLWPLVLGMAATTYLSISEMLPGGDSVNALVFGQAFILGLALLVDHRRRRTIARVYRQPEGLVFETCGLLRPVHRYARNEDLARIHATAPDVEGRMTLRLPDRGPPLVLHVGNQGVDLGLPEPPHRKRR